MLVEVCLRVVDKINADAYLDPGCTKNGDVIEVLLPGSDWGTDVWANTDLRIVLIDAPVTFIESLMASEEGGFVDRMPRKRKYKTNIDMIPQPYRNRILGTQGEVIDLSGVDLSPYVTIKDLL